MIAEIKERIKETPDRVKIVKGGSCDMESVFYYVWVNQG